MANTASGNGGQTQDSVNMAQFGKITPAADRSSSEANSEQNLALLYDIPLRVEAQLGNASMSIKDLLALGPGAVIELERMAGESIDLLVNGVLIGRGDVVVVNENFGLRVTEITGVKERLEGISS